MTGIVFAAGEDDAAAAIPGAERRLGGIMAQTRE